MDGLNRVDSQGVFPKRVLACRHCKSRYKDRIQECDIFAGLIKLIIPVYIIQGINAILARLDVTNGKLPFVVRTRCAVERECAKGRISQVAMQTNGDAGHRLQILCIQDRSGYLQRVDNITCREGECKVFQDILFVVVGNRVGEINRIGHVLFQRIQQLNLYLFSCATNNRHFALWRCDNHILRRIVQLNQLIKQNLHLLSFVVGTVGNRYTAYELRGKFIIRAAVGIADIRTSIEEYCTDASQSDTEYRNISI